MAEPSTVECPGCFQQKGSESATCPRCGYNSNTPRSLSLLPVQTQLKRYLIGEKLGQGGFGITYRGFDLKLKMRVAIKEYYPSDFVSRSNDRKTVMLISSENGSLFQYGLQAFVNEAHTLAQLQHPNLVRVLNLFEMNGTAYLVMDYYEGETLHDYLARQPDKKLPWRRAVSLLLPVLDGLAEVHRNGFMHRDVKPRNLYLTQRGQLVLLDFGAARQVVSDRTRSLAIYTSGYAAYEQHVQSEQGPWTDVYGVAATLYFALTAHVPPPASERKKKDSRQPARHFSPDLPPALDNVLNRALVVEPKKRLQTIEEFEQQLRAVLKQEEDKPRAEPSMEVKPRNPRLWAMAGALLLAVVAASVIGIVIPSPKPPEQRPTPVAGPPLKSVEPPPAVAITPPPPPKREEPVIPLVVAPVLQTPPVEPVIPSGAEPKPPPSSEASPVAEPAPAPNPNPERTYLTVKTEPLSAQIRIMNIGPAYQDGIELMPGGFDIEISALGYQTRREWHDLAAGVQELKIALQAETKPPLRRWRRPQWI